MKKIIIALFLIIGFQVQSQDKVVTSDEEYNYLTKGYAQDLKTGHNLKTGYSLEKFYEKKHDDYNFIYYYFIDILSKKTKAVLIIGKKEKGKDDKFFYMCLPFNNEQLFKKAILNRSNGVSMSILYEEINYYLLAKSFDLLKNNPTGKFE